MLNQAPVVPDRVFHALGDPTRAAMVERLSRGPASVSELARPLPMSLPAVVQHLAVLETCGLVSSRKAGRVRTCRIEPAALRTAEDWVAQRRAIWEAGLDRLAAYLAETTDARAPRPAADRARRVGRAAEESARRSGTPAEGGARRGGRPAEEGARRSGTPAEGGARRGGRPAEEGARRGGKPAEEGELGMRKKEIVTDRNQRKK